MAPSSTWPRTTAPPLHPEAWGRYLAPVYWLQPPPHLRRAAAALLIVGAFLWDLRGPASVPHPFVARPISRGSAITADDVEWRSITAGALPAPDLEGAVAAVNLTAGDPLIPAVLSGGVSVPGGWWAVSLDAGRHATPGLEVLLVVVDPPITTTGIVVEAQRGDRLSLDYRPALVAVPGEVAAVVAAADHAGLLVTAVRP